MAVKIIGTTSGVELETDSVSKAARVTLYATDGTELIPEPAGTYGLKVNVAPSTLTSGTIYWAMRNTGTKVIRVRNIYLQLGFTATTALASRSSFELVKTVGGTWSGGTSLGVGKFRTSFPASDVGYAAAGAAGLTATGATFDNSVGGISITSANTATSVVDLDVDLLGELERFTLNNGEGLAIRADGAVISGCYVSGAVWWSERAA